MNHDQTAPKIAVRSESILFAIQATYEYNQLRGADDKCCDWWVKDLGTCSCIVRVSTLTYRVYKAPFCQYGLDSENLPSLSIKSRNGQQHGASRTTTRNPMHLKIDKNSSS